jgi:hypothetical protein
MKRIFFCVVICILGGSARCIAQSPAKDQDCSDKARWIRQISAPDGWNLDFVNKAEFDGQERSFEKLGPAYVGVIEVHYKSRKRMFEFPDVVVEDCAQSVSIKKSFMNIEEGFIYKKDGRVFAHRFVGETVVLRKGEWISCMCRFALTIYDSSGSGTFDELHVGEGAMGGAPQIPKWLK